VIAAAADIPPSAALCRALAPFALDPRSAARTARADADHAALRALVDLPPNTIALLTGPSGCGKSTLLRAAADALRARTGTLLLTLDPAPLARDPRPLLDTIPGPPERALSALARAGLAEPALFATPARHLSEGQRWRAALALALRAAERAHAHDLFLLLDECAAPLDRLTAASALSTLARAVRAARTPLRLIAAGAHEDLPALLRPDLRCEIAPRVTTLSRPAAAPPALTPTISTGSLADYDALAHHHYRASRPATRVLIRVAHLRVPHTPEPVRAAVLVVSMPTLNAAWRQAAWPGRYTLGPKPLRAQRLNAELRCLSRVIVDPRCRGLGLARTLVADYLARPLTPRTEAVAAMGRLCPFFARAGMTPIPCLPSPADARLADALHARGIDPALLLRPADALAACDDPFLARELRTWQRSSPRQRLRDAPLPAVARAAAMRIAAPPLAFASDATDHRTGDNR
jgi:ABC-type iron transport system FetAB ATPase subunit